MAAGTPKAADGGSHLLYGARGSGSAAIEAALTWTGVPFRIVEGATWEPGEGFEALKATSRLHQVPTLVLPDGTVMTESAAILIHLGLAHPASGLLPADAPRRARALRGLVYVAANCYAAIGVIDYPERWLPASRKPARDALVAGARERLHALWSVFAETFVEGDARYLGGEAPDALDLLAAVVSKWSGARAYLKAKQPALSAIVERLDQHPKLQPVFARHWS
ncbi:MAG TPA: glutathione S-transferase [Methylibium sp.]|uniref:glutathione S-transferase family protein n=1 Tax=Methylibium sp. TaxID=2067992 RepID=UPI002DBE2073|nr:glutathione S-transferase [Methylibium sp.]HEU4458777.1 glutathione S-transferase [Methylibium sp.]